MTAAARDADRLLVEASWNRWHPRTRRAQALQPDLTLLDNHLPGVNCVAALPALRESAPAARVLITLLDGSRDLRRWRLPAALAAAILLIFIGSKIFEIRQLNDAERKLEILGRARERPDDGDVGATHALRRWRYLTTLTRLPCRRTHLTTRFFFHFQVHAAEDDAGFSDVEGESSRGAAADPCPGNWTRTAVSTIAATHDVSLFNFAPASACRGFRRRG